MAFRSKKNKFDLENLGKEKSSSWTIRIIIAILILLVILFLGVFVCFPVAVGCSLDLQRFLLFKPGDFLPENLTYKNVESVVEGSRNFYLQVNEELNLTLGVVHLLPEALINESKSDKNFDYEASLNQSTYPVLLHFHGTGGNRFTVMDSLIQLRKIFHIISFDYRGYGESTVAEFTEDGFIKDSIDVYKWLRGRTGNDNIYIWGHSLGAAIATHTLADIYDQHFRTKGLILEAPFTTVTDELEVHPLAKIFSWVPWFKITVQDGYERNKIIFKTTENILRVNCPVLILHARDDDLIPFELGEKLYKISSEKRTVNQGNVTFREFPAELELKHVYLFRAPEFLNYVRSFVDVCEAFDKRISNETDTKEILL